MKSVPIRGSVGSVIADSGVDMETDPTLPRIGTDFMTHKLKLHQYPRLERFTSNHDQTMGFSKEKWNIWNMRNGKWKMKTG